MLSLIRRAPVLRTVGRAAGKAIQARLRQLGIGSVYPGWMGRAELCERCPLRVVRCGQSYCGNPLLSQVDRDPAIDGCGCPTRAKAKDPAEHCPIDSRLSPAIRSLESCTCKWCTAGTGLVNH